MPQWLNPRTNHQAIVLCCCLARPPEIGFKLWLIPADRVQGDRIVPPAPFDKLLDNFREAQVRFCNSPDWIFVHPVGEQFNQDEHHIVGHLKLWLPSLGRHTLSG